MEVRSDVDCEKGRKLGCATYCCRLLVRLDPDEREPSRDGLPAKGFVDKDEKGCCVHLHPVTHRCRIWERRPRVCREYTCNGDVLLQVVLQTGFVSITRLVTLASQTYLPKECYVRVPYCGEGAES